MSFRWRTFRITSHLYWCDDDRPLCNLPVPVDKTREFDASARLCATCSKLKAQFVETKFTLKESFSPAEKQA